MEMTQNVWKRDGNEVSNLLPNDGKFLPKRLILKPKNPFIEVSTRKSAGDHFNQQFYARKDVNSKFRTAKFSSVSHTHTEPWADLEFGNGIPNHSYDFGNGNEEFGKTLEWNGNGVWNFESIWNGNGNGK